ncbi:MAG: hypothetical protein IJ526_09445 [Lachnospiraceae bacterium]|nr:hypothetical protein [Lachnospiraceae bacterium]
MRKNIKNDKVIKAITIGLAAMIAATSVPTSVYADEAEGADNSTSQSESSSSESTSESSEIQSENTGSSSEDSSAAAQTAGECVEMVNNDVPAAAEAVNDAVVAIEAIDPANKVISPEDQAIVADIQDGLVEVAGDIALIGDEEGNLADASAAIGSVLVSDIAAENAANVAEEQLAEAETQQTNFNNAKQDTTEDADSAIDNSDVANTSNSRSEAYQAKDDAEAALEEAKEGLAAATEAYDKTAEAVAKADDEYNKAVEQQSKANKKLEEAKSALNDASANATAANERLKEIQSQMDALNQKVEDLAKQKEDLEKLNDQYYKLMVHFYREKGAAKYDNGTLDIEASAEAAKSKETSTANENTFMVGRALMAELIEFKLKANGVDPSAIHIGEEVEGGVKKEMSEGNLVKDDKGNDRVTIGDKEDIWLADYGKGNVGRGNAFKVTYTIVEDGVEKEVTEYYNYVLKSKEGEKDLENGPIFLAKIDLSKTGEDMVSRDTDPNNMDDLRNLNKRIEEAMKAARILDEYEAAKSAVDEAQKLVEDLTSAIDTLNKTELKFSNEKVNALKDALEAAKEELEAAKEEKSALEDKVDEAQKAVEAIDLSRFNVTPADGSDETDESDDTEDTTETPAVAVDPSATVTPTGVTVTVPGLGIAPIVLPAAPAAVAQAGASESTLAGGVLGARVAEDLEERVFGGKLEEGAEEDFVIAPNTDLVEEVFGMDDNETGRKLVKIEDNAVPLAAMPEEDGVKMNWWWLLIILLLGATGKKMYDEHQKKVAAREEANR